MNESVKPMLSSSTSFAQLRLTNSDGSAAQGVLVFDDDSISMIDAHGRVSIPIFRIGSEAILLTGRAQLSIGRFAEYASLSIGTRRLHIVPRNDLDIEVALE